MSGAEGDEVSADDAVEHFFEGLDEDAFIANLQVVSAWDSDEDEHKAPAHRESALSRFSSYLPPPAPLGLRRDPDKTKRDIEKDKANKSKDNLIKKMVSGLVPPGMEMDNADTAEAKKPVVEQHPDDAKFKKSPFRERSTKGNSRRSSKSESRNRRSPYRRNTPPDKFRRMIRPPVYKRERRYEISPRRMIERNDSRERRRNPRYRSRSRSRESPPRYRRKPSRPKEDFLTYLAKKNLNGPKYSVAPSQTGHDYNLQSSLPFGMPSADTISVQYPPPTYSVDASNYNTSFPPPSIPGDVQNLPYGSYYEGANPIPYSTAPPTYGYDTNGYNPGTFQETPVTIQETNPIYADLNVNYNANSTNVTDGANLTDNLFDSFRDCEEKCKLIKNCEAIVKTLKNPRVLSNLALTSTEDIQQRDTAYSYEIQPESKHCSPLNRDTTNYYNYTKTGNKSRLLVPIVLATIGTKNEPVKSHTRDIGVQTVKEQCDRCQCRGSFKKVDSSTTSFGKVFSKSVYSQVREEDLASSKMIFTPNQNTLSEPQKPVSLTHMTPAQILVAELTAKAKSLQRSAVDSYRMSGNTDDQMMRFDAAFEDLKNDRKFPYQPPLFQNTNYKSTHPNNDAMSQSYSGDSMKKRGNKNHKNAW